MSVTAAQVRELRDITDAPMMECKKALVETGGDVEKAIELMRKSGQAKAAKKAGRIAAEGIVLADVKEGQAILLEVNSETDFVARDASFLAFANELLAVAFANRIGDLDALLAAKLGDVSVDEARANLIAKIGENISIRRIARLEGSNLTAYIHGNRIGVIAALEGGDAELARGIAMHVAANHPVAIDSDGVSAEWIEKEKEIFSAQAQASGKGADIIEKMIAGRITKFLKEVTLVGQPFVKDPNISVEDLLKSAKAKVNAFIRYEVGEGIEKEKSDFVAEVMAQARGA